MNKFAFNPPTGLLDEAAFPTNPTTQQEARGQVQTPMNQLRDFINDKVKPTIDELESFEKGFENKLSADDGYIKLNNGLIIQWGIVEVQKTNYDMNVEYPTKFPNVCLGVWFCDTMNVVDDKRERCDFKTWNTSKLDSFAFNGTGFSNWVYPRWVAIGY